MRSKRSRFLAFLAAGLVLTGCKNTQSTEGLKPETEVEISYETDNHEIYHQKQAEIEREKQELNIEKVKELMEMCETMASQSEASHHIDAIITQFEQENREQDAKGYTEWTNPEGELHNSKNRLFQDVYNMLKNIDKYDGLIKLGDNKYALDNSNGGIYIYDVYPSRFMTDYTCIEVDQLKMFLLSLVKDSFNELMNKMGLECEMDFKVYADLMGNSLDPDVIQANNIYVGFDGKDMKLVTDLTEIVQRWMKCTFSADESSEIVASIINTMLYNRAVENSKFAEWIMDPTCSYAEYSSHDTSTTFSFLEVPEIAIPTTKLFEEVTDGFEIV